MPSKKIAVVYHSQQSGNTHHAAELVAEGAGAKGFDVDLVNTNETRPDPAMLADCAGVAFGTPDYFSYPAGTMKVFIDDWLIAQRKGNEEIEGMPVALFMTHGGGGAARGPFEQLFGRVGDQVGETVSVVGSPEGDDADACRALGGALADAADAYLEG